MFVLIGREQTQRDLLYTAMSSRTPDFRLVSTTSPPWWRVAWELGSASSDGPRLCPLWNAMWNALLCEQTS